ncbi:MAG: hypothetical protein ACRDIB_16920, partial [Ardenticatenaceae bacterium]
TYSIMPLGGMQAGAIASFIGTPFAIAIGGMAVVAFAIGPASINGHVRNLGNLLAQFERGGGASSSPQGHAPRPAAAAGSDD